MRRESTGLSELVTAFFSRHLAVELNASPHTIRSYRDTFRLLLGYLTETTRRRVFHLTFDDFHPEAILSFLENLELHRGNSVATRNTRLAAIRSFFAYAVTQDVATAAIAQRIQSLPFKKSPGRLLDPLSKSELQAILNSPDRSTREGRRDYLLLALLYDTGARVQELADVCPVHFRLDRLPLVRITGKGRKQRIVPLWPATATLVRDHLKENGRPTTDPRPLLRNHRGDKINRSGIRFVVDKHRYRASVSMPALRRKGISPHTFRHTKAMNLLQAGVAPVTIKDILGHAHLKTLEVYVRADLEMRRQALEATYSPVQASLRVPRTEPDLMHWLEQL